MQWIITRRKKFWFSVLCLMGHLGKNKQETKKNRKIVFPSLVAFSSESGAKVKLKLNRRLDNEK